MKRGDQIGVNCTFTTTSATLPTYQGEGTYDEMCYAFLLLYPFDSSISTFCQETDGYGICGQEIYGDFEKCNVYEWFGTAWKDLERLSLTLREKCDATGMDCIE